MPLISAGLLARLKASLVEVICWIVAMAVYVM